jgi:probable rRNA maturation factor
MSDTAALLDIVIEQEGWSELEGLADRCEAAVAAGLSKLEAPRTGQTVVLLTDDKTVHALNAKFRGKDKPTNVLSFPAPEAEGYPGDVALAFETCAAEAERDGKSLIDHAVHLVLHGVLHLNGLDHNEEDEAAKMEALERAALGAVGIADPYIVKREP